LNEQVIITNVIFLLDQMITSSITEYQ